MHLEALIAQLRTEAELELLEAYANGELPPPEPARPA